MSKFEQGGEFGSILMATDAMPKRFTGETNPEISERTPGASRLEERKEQVFLNLLVEYSQGGTRKVTPEVAQQILDEVEAQYADR